jgi:hypothetical protein
MSKEERPSLAQQLDQLEQERRDGAVAAVRAEMEEERRQLRMGHLIGAFVIVSLGGCDRAAERLLADPDWGPALDRYFTDVHDRRLLGLPVAP